MLLCLHEESAVAIAHGYAKVTGRAMAAAVHSNVGLMHATMAIFNAWCDRMPVLRARRDRAGRCREAPALDRLDPHRARPGRAGPPLHQMGRPAGLARRRARSAAARGVDRATPRRMGPVYVNLDAEMQEAKLAEPLPPIEAGALHAAGRERAATARAVAQAAALLKAAKNPVMLIGRASRSVEAWNARVRLAEAIGARVITDLKVGASFPTDHPLHLGAPSVLTAGCRRARGARQGRRDPQPRLGRSRRHAEGREGAGRDAKVISVTVDHQIHNGWSMDHQGLAPVDLLLAADPEHAVPLLVDGARRQRRSRGARRAARRSEAARRRPAHRRAPRARAARGGRRHALSRSPICRCPGTARGGRSAIRSTSSAPTAAAGSAPAPASRSARRSR